MNQGASTSRELWPLSGLRIVGYANVLTQTMLPSVVAPIFSTDDGTILFPPFTLTESFASNPTVSNRAELEELASRKEVTILQSPFAAQPNHELWVDQNFAVHYELQALVDKKLRELSRKYTEHARAFIRNRQFPQATQALRVALSADDRWVDPYILEALIARLNNDSTGVAIAKTAAGRAISSEAFDCLLQSQLMNLGASGSVIQLGAVSENPTVLQHRPMHLIALVRPPAQELLAAA